MTRGISIQVNYNLEREYRDCIKSRSGITRHIIMHQALYKCACHPLHWVIARNIYHLVHYDMPRDPKLVSSAFYTIPIFPLFF